MKNRRLSWLIVGAAWCLCAGAGTACGGGSSGSNDVVAIAGFGGDVSATYEEVWWRPLEERAGLTVREHAPADFTKLKTQVESDNVIWDVTEIATTGQYLQAIEEGLVEQLDRDLLQRELDAVKAGDLTQDFVEGSVGTHGVWNTPYGTILMFDKRRFPDSEPQPSSLDDLWNFEDFPGKRCINNTAVYNLEIALRVDGVPRDELYPLDVERALRKLDELKPEVAKFWSVGSEPVQLVSDGECVMSTVWSGRPYARSVLEGVDYLGIAWENGIFETSWLAIPKGTSNREAAYKALAQYMTPKTGAGMANQTGYPNGSKRLEALIKPEAEQYLATNPDNLAVLTPQDAKWWLENGAETEETFAEWVGG
jgi:putative spermidine/putrescine transport system substrate-binding protein